MCFFFHFFLFFHHITLIQLGKDDMTNTSHTTSQQWWWQLSNAIQCAAYDNPWAVKSFSYKLYAYAILVNYLLLLIIYEKYYLVSREKKKTQKPWAWAAASGFWDLKPEPQANLSRVDGFWQLRLPTARHGRLWALSLSRHITNKDIWSLLGMFSWCFSCPEDLYILTLNPFISILKFRCNEFPQVKKFWASWRRSSS